MATVSVTPGASVLNPAQTSTQIADVLGDGFPDGSFLRVQNTDMVAASLKETTLAVSTTKDFQAKKFQAAEKTLELGPGLGIGAAGGEVLYHDMTTGTEQHFLAPRKPYSNVNGTAGSFTSGRVIGAFSTVVLQPGDTVLSNSVTAQVGVNTDPTKVKFLYTITDPTDVVVTQLIGRFNAAQTGVRMVIRHTNASGQIIFTSEPDWTYTANQGLSVAGTGDTTFDTEENPILFRSGSTYHITIESNVGAVVMKGAMVSGAFLPYISRRRATVVNDPVVARGAETITAGRTLGTLDWYETKYLNGTFDLVLPGAAGSAGLDIRLINIGTGNVTLVNNAGTPASLSLGPGEEATFEGDGSSVRWVDQPGASASDVTGLAETIAGVESRLGVIEAAGDATGPDNGLMASVASLAGRVETISVRLPDPIHASLASLVERLERLQIPGITGLQAAVVALASRDDEEEQARNDADQAITETIAGVEARITVLENDVDETGPDNGLMASIASLVGQVQALDIPAVEGIYPALVSLVARLEALPDRRIDGLQAAVASLAQAVQALPAPNIDGLEAGLSALTVRVDGIQVPVIAPSGAANAAQQAHLDRHGNRLESGDLDRVALAETVAGVEATITGNDALSQSADNGIHASLASSSANSETQRQIREDSDISITESLAGVEADLAARRTFFAGTSGGVTLGATGVWADVTGNDAVLQAGIYELTLQGTYLTQSDAIGNNHSVAARFFDVTANALLESLGFVFQRNNTLFFENSFSISRIYVNNTPRTIRAQFQRNFTGTPVILTVSQPRVSWRRIG